MAANPPVELRERLARCREQRMSFKLAWSCSMLRLSLGRDASTRREWKVALAATREEWKAAYYREPSQATRPFASLAPLAEHAGSEEPHGRAVEVAA